MYGRVSADGWASAFEGMGEVVKFESDDSLRDRLVYVAGETPQIINRIMKAPGAELDLMAEEYGLKRRKLS